MCICYIIILLCYSVRIVIHAPKKSTQHTAMAALIVYVKIYYMCVSVCVCSFQCRVIGLASPVQYYEINYNNSQQYLSYKKLL